jgi:uncharacterized protein YfkK (UPF0435 family)
MDNPSEYTEGKVRVIDCEIYDIIGDSMFDKVEIGSGDTDALTRVHSLISQRNALSITLHRLEVGTRQPRTRLKMVAEALYTANDTEIVNVRFETYSSDDVKAHNEQYV